MASYLVYPMVGAVAGLLAGLLGVGGGLVVVPALLHVFAFAGLPPELRMRLALGTSLAAICFTSLSSLRAHQRHGAVEWGIVRAVTPGIVLGTLAGAGAAGWVPGVALEVIFAAFLVIVCVRMFRQDSAQLAGRRPGTVGMSAAGAGIGLVSGLVGIGGGSLSVPFLLRRGVPMHRAVGTSAAIGVPIAVVGAVGYVLGGLGVAELPALAVGYVYLPALVGVASVSVFFAPLGAHLAHRLPVARLRRAFAVFLLVVALRMLLAQL